eukprot:TRINITY_DN1479_c0_g2_i3.p1 TRINITY_DN1479_c0_g2~~TRINITY_DN1479_c0_g2_i3.p1  ORF type:complete len:989 (-),score=204.70 TRINITY_DN1479_c0_g2_i3:614-3580(-)
MKRPSRLSQSSSLLNNNSSLSLPNLFELSDLPVDIIFNIFTFLNRKDLLRASSVCKLWRDVARDPIFGWTTVLTSSFNLTPDASLIDETTQIKFDVNTAKFFNEAGELLFTASLYSDDTIPKFYSYCTDHPTLFRWYLSIRYRLEITFEVHIRNLEQTVNEGLPLPAEDRIFYAVRNEDWRFTQKFLQTKVADQSANLPMKPLIPQSQPIRFRAGLELHKYQLEAVSWMKSVEEDSQIAYEYIDLTPWRSANCSLLFDLRPKPNDLGPEPIHFFYPKEYPSVVTLVDLDKFKRAFTTKGGVLGDEMGLGKTIEVIGLILSHPSSHILEPIPFEEDPKTNKTKKKNAPRQKRPRGETFRPWMVSQEEARVEENFDEKELIKKFKTGATLVLCPSHLSEQWANEISKNSSPPLKVCRATTISQLKHNTYSTFLTADVVVASYQLLKNPNYLSVGLTPGRLVKERNDWIEDHLRVVRRDWAKGISRSYPILEHFQWYRLILDEGHEVISEGFMASIDRIETQYKWYVSGTPFPREDCIVNVCKFLGFTDFDEYNKHHMMDIMLNNLYWRNTIESSKSEHTVPPLIEDLVLLDLTDFERALYLHAATLRNPEHPQRQLCCWPFLLNDSYGDRIKLTEMRKRAIINQKSYIETEETRLISARKDLERATNAPYPQSDTIDYNHKHVEELTKNIAIQKKVLYFYQITAPDISTRYIRSEAETKIPLSLEEIELYEINKEKEKEKEKEQEQEQEQEKEKTETENQNKNNKRKLSSDEISSDSSKRNKDGNSETNKSDKLGNGTSVGSTKTVKISDDMIIVKKEEEDEEGEGEGDEEDEDYDDEEDEGEGDEEEEEYDEISPPELIKDHELDVAFYDANNLTQEYLRKLVDSYGTKVANLLIYLKTLFINTPSARVILFSQTSMRLTALGEILEMHNISCSFVQGNVHRRTKALRDFKKGDSPLQVILLSLDRTASGSNLIEATHIILFGTFIHVH